MKYEVWTNRGVSITIEADDFDQFGNLIYFYNKRHHEYSSLYDKISVKWFSLFNIVSITPVKKEKENV